MEIELHWTQTRRAQVNFKRRLGLWKSEQATPRRELRPGFIVGEKMVKKFTTMYYYGKSAGRESRRDLKIARSFGKTASLRQTKKGFVLRVGRR